MSKKFPMLSKILKRLLFENDLNATQLSKKVQIPIPTIHKLVSGQSQKPYIKSLEPIANYFNITVNQLVGEDPFLDTINDKKIKKEENENTNFIKIPIFNIDFFKQNQEILNLDKNQKYIISNEKISEKSFSIIMNDSSMSPLFPKDCLLIFDPERVVEDRSFVFVFIHEKNIFIFRQLIIDLEKKYLKPINNELSNLKMRVFKENKDKIIGSLVESRNNFNLIKGFEL